MTPEQLKNSILQLAIQGKLVKQKKEEGTGEELYKEIQEEKKKLIEEGKLKKQKSLPEITEDEIPFDIPDSWKWVKLGDCTGYAQTKVKISPKDIRGDMWSLDLEDIQKETGAILVKTKASERKITGDKVMFYKGQVLYSKLRPYLKKILVAPDDGICTPELVPFDTYLIDENYISYVLRSPHIDYVINSVTYGVKMPRVGTDTMINLLIPLPSLAEQKRIVAKIEELLPLVDRYSVSYEKLEQFNAKFSEDMKKSILQYAIQGKLVEQRPEDGTGEELYQQIQVEKQRLIAEKNIKKEKPLAEISEDEIPFDIPESWKWIRVGEIFAHNTGKAMNSTAKKVDKPGSVKRFITTSNLYWNSFDFSSVKEMFFSDDELERCTVTKGDLLMCEGGAYYGRTAIWNYDYDICFQNHVHRLRPYKAVELRFFYHLFYFYKSMNMVNAKGTAMPGLSSQTLHQMVVPFPPFSEQKRIVAKIEELLPLCERLK
jgi:putative type I restriction-modification system, S subunit